jgi:pimeloyl-ACP methyl ester carboxylesterase
MDFRLLVFLAKRRLLLLFVAVLLLICSIQMTPSLCLVAALMMPCSRCPAALYHATTPHDSSTQKYPHLHGRRRGSALHAQEKTEMEDSLDLKKKNDITIREEQFDLSTGVSMQALYSFPVRPKTSGDKKRPVLLFLHGSFHAAWCWSEHYLDYFVNKGYPVVALSWRGTGGTFAGNGVTKVKIQQHVADLKAFLDEALPSIMDKNNKVKPVLIAHSFGSLAVMKMLEMHPSRLPDLSGIAMMCAVPPSGNRKLTMRYLRRSLSDSWKITAGFAMKRCLQSASLCRELFLGGEKQQIVLENGNTIQEDYGISDDDVQRYMRCFARDSVATIDMLDFAKQAPSMTAVDGGKRAPFLVVDNDDETTTMRIPIPPRLVIGATRDFIVDYIANQETAEYFTSTMDKRPVSVVQVDSPHDVMLGVNWRNGAMALEKWLEQDVVGN